MAEGQRERVECEDRLAWNHTLAINYQLYNANRDPNKEDPIDWRACCPYFEGPAKAKPKPPTEAEVQMFRQMFGRKP